MSYPPHSSPGAADEAWSTPARPPGPVISPSPAGGGTPETPDPIVSPGIQGAKADDVSASVAGAVAAAQTRFTAHEADTHPQSSTIGTPIDLPPVVSDWSKHTGGSDATASR